MKNQKVIAEIKKIIKNLNLNCVLEKFKNKANQNCISISQKLSENFITEFQDKENWNRVSMYQRLPENFI
jgi:hypothetical protein